MLNRRKKRNIRTQEAIDLIISFLTSSQLEDLSFINIKTGKKITFREQMISFYVKGGYYPAYTQEKDIENLVFSLIRSGKIDIRSFEVLFHKKQSKSMFVNWINKNYKWLGIILTVLGILVTIIVSLVRCVI